MAIRSGIHAGPMRLSHLSVPEEGAKFTVPATANLAAT